MKTCQLGMSTAITTERCDQPGEWCLIVPEFPTEQRGPMCLVHLSDILKAMPAGMCLVVSRYEEVTTTTESQISAVKQRTGWVEP